MEGCECTVFLLFTKLFQGGVLGRSSESQVGRIATHLAGFHGFEDLVLIVLFLVLPHHSIHIVVGSARLGAMRLIYDHREAFIAEVFNAIHNKREFLNGGDNDLFAVLQCALQLRRLMGRSNNIFNLREFLDVIPQLLVQQSSICHDDNRVKQRLLDASPIRNLQ